MAEIDSTYRQSDHDLLVTIHTKLERAIDDIKELKDNMSARIAALEGNKFDKKEGEDMQASVMWLQRIAFGGIGILFFLELYFKFFKL